jgi:succinate dehydrogenase/fumarate reductase flavoprotein subunit
LSISVGIKYKNICYAGSDIQGKKLALHLTIKTEEIEMKAAISRRNFLKTTVCTATGLAAAGMLSACSSTSEQATSAAEPASSEAQQEAQQRGTYADTIAWDGEYDVVVIGFGGSGANAAYAAAKEGADVLAVEAAPEGEDGGNFRLAGQMFLEFSDYDSAYSYTKAQFGGYDVDEDMLKAWCEGVTNTGNILEEMGADRSQFTSAETFGLHAEYDFKGIENRQEYAMHNGRSDAYMWKFIKNCCAEMADKIDLWLESPAKHLIQAADTKTILGVQVEHEDKLVNIRARNGVVLCCGGFENNHDMMQQYLGIQEGVSMATPYNKGDGIKMAQEIGADMCHMWAYDGVMGPYGSAVPMDEEKLVTSNSMFNQTPMKSGAVMAVTKGGTRFINEMSVAKHGKLGWGGGFYNARWAEKSYVICDSKKYEEVVADGCLADYMDKFVSGDTIEQLCEKLDMDAAALQTTIDDFAAYIDMGKDYLTGRDVSTMEKFGAGPYYALPICPGFHATRGGPRKNAQMQILAPDGEPIPHLYGAGECGSFYAHLREGGGGTTECIIFGQIAGRNAATKKDELPLYDATPVASNLVYTIGSSSSALVQEGADVELGENEYLGTSENGMGGKVQLKVTIENGKITAIEVVKQNETESIGVPAFEPLIEQALSAQSSQLDMVSGASVTSNAFMEALQDAMQQAGL